jgi:hypothetical protein
MRREKKTVLLKQGDFLIGFGHKTAIKYLVGMPHENGGWVIKTVEEKPVIKFHYKSNTFTDGSTLYKNGLRCYLYNKVKDRQWKAIKSRQSVYQKLVKISEVVNWSKKASDARILDIDVLLDNFIEGYKQLRRRKNGKTN